MSKYYLQIYTGNGKGKTTAAIGVALRSLGAGNSVYIGQFLKKGMYNEINMLENIKKVLNIKQTIKIEQFGSGEFIIKSPSESDIIMAQNGFEKCLNAVKSGVYKLVILDELNTAINLDLIPLSRVEELLKYASNNCEVIITGRNAPEKLLEIADLVTSMTEVKHYIEKGVEARPGIEL